MLDLLTECFDCFLDHWMGISLNALKAEAMTMLDYIKRLIPWEEAIKWFWNAEGVPPMRVYFGKQWIDLPSAGAQ